MSQLRRASGATSGHPSAGPSAGEALDVERTGNVVRIRPRPAQVGRLLSALEAALHYRFSMKEMKDYGRKAHTVSWKCRLYGVDEGGEMVVMTYASWRYLRKSLEAAGFLAPSLNTPREDHFAGKFRPDPENFRKIRDRCRFAWRGPQERMFLKVVSSECGMVHVAGGVGKSSSFLWTVPAYFPEARILAIFPGRTLVTKAASDWAAFDYVGDDIRRPVLSEKVHQLGGGKTSIAFMRDPRWLCVSTIQSAEKLLELAGPETGPDIILVDELHLSMHARACQTILALALQANSRIFGFTATPEWRADGADLRARALYGPTICRMTEQEAVEAGLTLPVEIRWTVIGAEHAPRIDEDDWARIPIAERTRWDLWRNTGRNRIIGELVHSLLPDQVLILLDRLDHLEFLRPYLPEGILTITGESTDAEIAEAERGFSSGRVRIVASTTWHSGMSFSALRHVVVASGDRRPDLIRQRAYRVNRLHPASGKTKGYVYDFFDKFARNREEASRERSKGYADAGYAGAKDFTEDWRKYLGAQQG